MTHEAEQLMKRGQQTQRLQHASYAPTLAYELACQCTEINIRYAHTTYWGPDWGIRLYRQPQQEDTDASRDCL